MLNFLRLHVNRLALVRSGIVALAFARIETWYNHQMLFTRPW